MVFIKSVGRIALAMAIYVYLRDLRDLRATLRWNAMASVSICVICGLPIRAMDPASSIQYR